MKPIIYIAGPTASGKSTWALEIAKSVGGEIINADALQVYADLQILSARPSAADMQDIPHHMFGHVSGDVRYSTGAWLREVQPIILDCLARDVVPILTGGTGLYFKALTEGIAEIPAISSEAMSRAQHLLDSQGIGALRDKAELIDAVAAKRVLGNDPQRLLRIVSVYEDTAKALSDWQAETRPIIPKAFCCRAVLLPERAGLYDRINTRFDNMIEGGGLDEAKAVFSKAYDATLPMMKAIGLKQFFPYLRSEVSLEECVEIAKRDTRRFAKRQFTWFRGQAKDWCHIHDNAQKTVFEANIPAKIL